MPMTDLWLEELGMSNETERIRNYRHYMEMKACYLKTYSRELRDVAKDAGGLPVNARLDVRVAIRQMEQALENLRSLDVSLPGEAA